MAKESILAGSTGQTIDLFIQDSTSTTGAGLTGLAFNTAGLTCYYNFPRGASAAVTLATLASATASWASGGFKEIDATNQPGKYRFDVPNALLAASSGRSVSMILKGAANMVPCPVEVELTAVDNQDAVRGGMTALPNANANANGGLPILSSSGTTLAYTISTLTTYTGNTPQTGDAFARIGAPAGASISADIQTRSVYSGGAVASVTGNVGGNVAGSVGSVATSVNLNLAQAGFSPRTLDSIADASLTVGDAMVAAISGATGKEAISGTSYTIKTPSTGTVIRTFTLDSASAPTQRN